MNCDRCGIPHYEDDAAAQTGGMGRLIAWREGLCAVCRDYRREQQAKAVAFLQARYRRQQANRQPAIDGKITDY